MVGHGEGHVGVEKVVGYVCKSISVVMADETLAE